MASSSPETNIGRPKGPEAAPNIVTQPSPIESHMSAMQLGGILEDINRISEQSASDPGEQWSSSGTVQSTAQGQQMQPRLSARDQAIAHLPPPMVMQKDLERHIREEVKNLRKQAQSIARIGKPGAAYHLNNLYTRIRHLNALLAEILHASADVVKRFFIRVFIDRQPIL